MSKIEEFLIYSGKVRNIYKLGDNHLLIRATDNVSSFDKHIGTITGKGELLNNMSAFWFSKTKHIMDNHCIASQENTMIVHKCTPFMIEVIVRGYITGNTNTSLWTHYNNGEREYCGLKFLNGLRKNQQLDEPVITPTTKGATDVPISKENIIKEGYMTNKECNYIFEKAMELFKYGQQLADDAGLILVDTKYEFGKNKDGKILLIDELHTCDSSRYWMKSTYNCRMYEGFEPDKLDKDCIRDWVKEQCDPYIDIIPEVPKDIIDKAYNCYKQFYDMITFEEDISTFPMNLSDFTLDPDFPEYSIMLNSLPPPPPSSPLSSPTQSQSNINKPITFVVILSGSINDKQHVSKITTSLTNYEIEFIEIVASAHKNTQNVLDTIKKYDNDEQYKIIWVTVAGRSNALSGIVAANSKYPVIACPPFVDKMDMLTNIHSTLQCPTGVPVMTILEPENVVLAIKKMV